MAIKKRSEAESAHAPTRSSARRTSEAWGSVQRHVVDSTIEAPVATTTRLRLATRAAAGRCEGLGALGIKRSESGIKLQIKRSL